MSRVWYIRRTLTVGQNKLFTGYNESPFKKTSYNYKSSWKQRNHVWEFKKKYNKGHEIKLSVLRRVKTYRCIDNICKQFQEEKLAILTFPDKKNLYNQRPVIMSKCKVFLFFFFRFLQLSPCPCPSSSDIFDL